MVERLREAVLPLLAAGGSRCPSRRRSRSSRRRRRTRCSRCRASSGSSCSSRDRHARSELLADAYGFMVTQSIGAVARAGVADLVAAGHETIDELAAETGAPAGLAAAARARARSARHLHPRGRSRPQHAEVGAAPSRGARLGVLDRAELRRTSTIASGDRRRAAFPPARRRRRRSLGSGYSTGSPSIRAEAAIFNRAMAAGSAAKLRAVEQARLGRRAGDRRRRGHRRLARRAAAASSGAARRRLRPAALGAGRHGDVRRSWSHRPLHLRERRLLRVGACRRRRLPALAHPPRLGRRAVAPDPASDSRCCGRRDPVGGHGQRAAGRRGRARSCRSSSTCTCS